MRWNTTSCPGFTCWCSSPLLSSPRPGATHPKPHPLQRPSHVRAREGSLVVLEIERVRRHSLEEARFPHLERPRSKMSSSPGRVEPRVRVEPDVHLLPFSTRKRSVRPHDCDAAGHLHLLQGRRKGHVATVRSAGVVDVHSFCCLCGGMGGGKKIFVLLYPSFHDVTRSPRVVPEGGVEGRPGGRLRGGVRVRLG